MELLDRLRKTFVVRPALAYIVLAFVVIMALEFATPPEFIFGYLYVGPILLSNWFLDRRSTRFVTTLSIALTLANLFVPRLAFASNVALVDRLITVAALSTVAYLGAKYRQVQEEAASQRAALQAQEERARVQEDFVATLTHDLKTPLLGADQTLAFLSSGEFGAISPQQRSVVETLHASNRTQLAMVETLLSIYRNDMSGLALQVQTMDLDELCKEQIRLLRDLASSREIHLIYEGEPSAFVPADRLQLGRVVANLIGNAIHHTPRGGQVEVRLVRAGDQEYRLLVEDTGSGIPRYELKRVFERFYQSESTRHVTGTGLGLYLSRQIVEAHCGRIWAANRPGGGCTFGVSLPGLGGRIPGKHFAEP